MAKKLAAKKAVRTITRLDMNGMHGRMLKLPAPKDKSKEILLIYGHHASLERMQGLADSLNQYGSVTLPDLPGFGGMDSFYKIGEKPTLDNLADYLAAFIKLQYRQRRITIIAVSFGFVVITRMLQRFPSIAKRVDLLISLVGFVHHDDFKFKTHNYLLLKYTAKLFSVRPLAWFGQNVILRPFVIKQAYELVADKHTKLRDADKAERQRRINFEIRLWQINDLRTYMYTTGVMFKTDLCNQKVDLGVVHVAVQPDRYFDNHIVEQHLRVIFKDVSLVESKIIGHAPTVIADAQAADPFIPLKIRRLLSKD